VEERVSKVIHSGDSRIVQSWPGARNSVQRGILL